jgi:hypothetical protein
VVRATVGASTAGAEITTTENGVLIMILGEEKLESTMKNKKDTEK